MDQNQLIQMLMQQGQQSQTQNQLNQRAQMAKMLMQGGQQTTSPIVAALSGFLGMNELQDIADKQGEVDRSAAQAEAAKDIYQIQYKEREFTESQKQFREQMAQNAKQFAEKMGLERDKFNLEKIRDAQNNALTKIADPKSGVDLLFKGASPVNDGLEKGLQWGIDKNGNRVAVPVPTLPSEKAATQKQLALEVVNRLLENKAGVKSVYGAVDRMTPNLLTSTRNAETDINALRAMTTLENLDLLKGAMSDNDIKFIQNASAGALNLETASQEGALAALESMKFTLEGRAFATEQEAEASGVKGKVLIGGRMAVIE